MPVSRPWFPSLTILPAVAGGPTALYNRGSLQGLHLPERHPQMHGSRTWHLRGKYGCGSLVVGINIALPAIPHNRDVHSLLALCACS